MTTQHSTVGEVFGAGADRFHRWSASLWDPVGEATAASGAPRPGERVLDACCGAGASALPAARAVESAGAVDAVDLARPLLDIAEVRARKAGLGNISFREHDVTTWPAPDGGYDLVQCALGVFFLPDMDRGTAALARMLRPGGRITVTVWERGALGAWGQAFKSAVETERAWPDSPLSAQLARIDTSETLTAWLQSLGLADARVVRHQLDVPLTPDTAWDLVLGSGTRAVLEPLTPAAVERVRARFTARLVDSPVTDLDVRFLTGKAFA